ncbi:unnamed protein product [Leptidea sinapis]|uniref:Reverse transcriptase domain-containing protein n=1 Tax=Leptidea sinapis TaxID=189913 RepID=A0A5E4QHR2_9NEOP|nr:unnamed protein product [Leptidea sinapis]
MFFFSFIHSLVFNLVMNHIIADLQKKPPWNILYADDKALISEDVEELETTLEQWRSALENAGLRKAQIDPQTIQDRMSWRRLIRRADPN